MEEGRMEEGLSFVVKDSQVLLGTVSYVEIAGLWKKDFEV